jgi:hypothetical protein
LTEQTPDPAKVNWAHSELEKTETDARRARSDLWSTLRDRMMTLAASTIPLSIVALGITNLPTQVLLIKLSWVALLVSIAFGFVSIILDYTVTLRAEGSAQAGNKLASGVIDEESIKIAEKRNDWWQKWSRPLIRIVDWSVYAGILSFWIGILLLVRFAWVNI